MLNWNKYNLRFDERLEYEDMVTLALQISNGLVRTPGYPVNWNSTNVKIIGLAKEDRVLSTEKLSNFVSLTSNQMKTALNIPLYNFYFALLSLNSSTINLTKYMQDNNMRIAYYQKETYMDEEMKTLLQQFIIDFYYKDPNPDDPECQDPCLGKQDLLANINNYNFILLEDPHLTYSSELAVVEEWVSEGGWLFVSEHIKETSLGITYFQRGKNDADIKMTVINTDPYLTLELGEWLLPEEIPYVDDTYIPTGNEFDAVDYITIAEYEDNTDGISRWKYGNGTIYYFSDFFIRQHNLPINLPVIVGNAMREIIIQIGGSIGSEAFTIMLSQGVDGGEKNVVSIRRYVTYENKEAILLFKLWN
jgi:hypothetical protein